ncbi:MAG: hypothetical protein JWM95_3673 [Gemmatimonadetes bacterium]|nr:hypothetical protein [Gemmatimonadota bacterium]
MHTEQRWGLGLAVALSLWTMLLHISGVYSTRLALAQSLDIVVMIIPIAFIAGAMGEQRRRSDSFGYMRAFRTGVFTMLISWPFSAAFMLLYHKIINPEWLDRLVAFELARLRASGAGASVLAKTESALRARASIRAELTSSVIGTVILGLALSGMLALVFRRRGNRGRT